MNVSPLKRLRILPDSRVVLKIVMGKCNTLLSNLLKITIADFNVTKYTVRLYISLHNAATQLFMFFNFSDSFILNTISKVFLFYIVKKNEFHEWFLMGSRCENKLKQFSSSFNMQKNLADYRSNNNSQQSDCKHLR